MRTFRFFQALSVASPFALMFLVGCATHKLLESKAELDQLTQRHGMGHLYYIGTESGYHYFATKHFAKRTQFYKLPVGQHTFQNAIPRTQDQTKWVPYLFNLNAGTKGFRGEPQEILTNSVVDQPNP